MKTIFTVLLSKFV